MYLIMDLVQLAAPLLLIPVCSLFNHLGGQSTAVPDPRIVFRVIGVGAAFAAAAQLSGVTLLGVFLLWEVATAFMALWAVFKWGAMFMAINGEDHRLYDGKWYLPNYWITKACDKIMGVDQETVLSPLQCRDWGTVYGTLRGAMMYPAFIALAYLLTPWALISGILSLSQGIIYRLSATVLDAEYRFGAIYGAMLASVLILFKIGL